jgi:hypothetical protein
MHLITEAQTKLVDIIVYTQVEVFFLALRIHAGNIARIILEIMEGYAQTGIFGILALKLRHGHTNGG